MYNKVMKNHHTPVLLKEVLAYLSPKSGESYLDLTAGYGGHAKAILDVTLNYKHSILVDRDGFAITCLREKFPPEVELMHMSFYNAVLQLIECGKTFDMILADFGVSSPQLDNGERGFSLKHDGPLDMRMDVRDQLTADTVVNHWSEQDLVDLFVKFGEESPGRSRLLAREIIAHRPITTTSALADLIASKSKHPHTHPATRIFQAIRIVVNDELGEIGRTLPLLPKLLKPGGRVGLITFHSLEDRLVKDFLRESISHGEESELSLLNRKPIVADQSELVINPRSRSAKLRVAVRN